MGTGLAAASFGSLAVNLLIPRLLPVAPTGLYYIASTIATLLPVVMRLGVDQAVVKLLAEERSKSARRRYVALIRGVLALSIVVGIVSATALVGGLWTTMAREVFGSRDLGTIAIPATIWITAEGLRSIFSESLRGANKILGATLLGDACRSSLFLGGVILLKVWSKTTFPNLIEAASLASLVTCIGAVVALMVHLSDITRTGIIGSASVRPLLTAGVPFMVTACWGLIISQGDLLVGGAVLDPKAVAAYGLAVKMSILIVLPMSIVNLILAPIIPAMWTRGDHQGLEKEIRTLATRIGLPTLLLSALLLAFAPELIGMVYSAGYAKTPGLLMILSIGPLATVLTGPNAFTLMMVGQGRVVATTTSLVSLAQLLAMVITARFVGVYGLAAASSAGPLLTNLYFALSIRRRAGLRTHLYTSIHSLASAFSPSL